jgi:RNA polymerase sigma factor (sigma-70 family)
MPDKNSSVLRSLLSRLLENKDLKRKFESYARRLLSHKTKCEFARHILPSDIFATVIQKLLTGEIKWDSKKASLNSFLFSRIRTEVTNLMRKEKKFIPAPLVKSDIFNDYTGEPDDDIPEDPLLLYSPFTEDDEEDKFDPEEFRIAALQIFEKSDEEGLVLIGIYDGLHTREIALNLGLTKDEVHNIKRRILRVLKKWVARNEKYKTLKPSITLINKDKTFEKTQPINKTGELI